MWSNLHVRYYNLTADQAVAMLRIAVKVTKLTFYFILLYIILARIYWLSLKISKSFTITDLENGNLKIPKPEHNATSQTKQIIINKSKSGLKVRQKKAHGWNKSIHQRRKDFGSLEEWRSEPDMKKVLLWTGYGPLQEGMLLWKRVLSDIGIMAVITHQ